MGLQPQAGGPGAKGQRFATARGIELFRPLEVPGGATPEALVDLFTRFTIPQFGGPLAAPADPLQIALTRGFEGGAINPLMNIATGADGSFTEDILRAGEAAERRRIGEEQSAIRERARIGGVRGSVGTGRAEAEVAARIAEQGLAERTRLAGELGLAERGQRLSAAQALPGAFQTGFGLGGGLQQIGDIDILRRLAEFQRTQGGLFGPALAMLTGQPTAFGPGKGSQLLSAATTIGAGRLPVGG